MPTTHASAGAGTSDLDAEEDEVVRVEDEMLRLATEMSLADASGS